MVLNSWLELVFSGFCCKQRIKNLISRGNMFPVGDTIRNRFRHWFGSYSWSLTFYEWGIKYIINTSGSVAGVSCFPSLDVSKLCEEFNLWFETRFHCWLQPEYRCVSAVCAPPLLKSEYPVWGKGSSLRQFPFQNICLKPLWPGGSQKPQSGIRCSTLNSFTFSILSLM